MSEELKLNQAAENGNLDEIKKLLEQGADTRFNDADCNQALRWAARKGHLEVVKWMDKKYPQLWEKKDHLHQTVLHDAVFANQVEVVKYLYEVHPQLRNIRDIHGRTAHKLSCFSPFKRNVFRELIGPGSKKILSEILEDDKNLAKGVPSDISNLICDFTGSLYESADADKKIESADADKKIKIIDESTDPLNRKALETRINEYISWSKNNASGTRLLSRFSHFHHGESGKERASNLLAVVQDEKKSDYEVLRAVEDAIRDSGRANHSLGRYLISVLTKIEIVGFDGIKPNDFWMLRPS